MKKITAVLCAVFSASVIFAQEAEIAAPKEAEVTAAKENEISLSIEEAVDYALKNSRTLKSNDIDLEMKKRASDVSWNVFLPTVQATGTLNRSNTSNYDTIVDSIGKAAAFSSGNIAAYSQGETIAKNLGYEDNETAHWSTIGGLSVSWNFTPAYISKIKIAKAQYEAGKISWEQSQNETLLNIKKLCYGLLLQQENLKIQKTTLENARQRMLQAEVNFKNGLVPEISLLQTQVNYENTKPTVDSAEQSFNQSMDTMAFLLGLPVGTKINLTSSIEPVYVDVETQDLLNKYANNDLSIQSMESNIKAAKLGITALDLSTWFPAFALSYAYQPVYAGVNAFEFAGDIGKSGKWSDGGSLSLTLAWNLTNMLPWSSNRQSLKDTKQQLRQAELGLETLKENQKVSVRKAVDTLNQAKQQIENMDRSVELAQKAYDMQYKSYRNGTTELLDLRDAESSLNQAKLGQLNQKYQYISALMDLENTLNVTLTGSSQSNADAK